MKVQTPLVGSICRSKQGRDKGRYYLIKSIESDGALMLVDGNFKKLCSPKRKNLRHVDLLPDRSEAIASKLSEGKQVFDTEIFSLLRPYNAPSGEE